MDPKINLKFFEREFILNPETGLAKDTKIVGIRDGGSIRIGRLIDSSLKLDYIDTLLCEAELDLAEQSVDLSDILNKDRDSIRWLDQFRKHFMNTSKGSNTDLRFENIPFTPLIYTKFPNDYFERFRHDQYYKAPRGIIRVLPEEMFYARIIPPPTTFKDGAWVSYHYPGGKVTRPDGIEEKYGIHEDEKDLFQARGILLGKLKDEDITNLSGVFEGGFPLDNFAEIVYPVGISEVSRKNPLSITLKLKN